MYFDSALNVIEARNLYMALVKMYHPAFSHGSPVIMRAVAREYHQTLRKFDGTREGNYPYWYNQQKEFASARKIGDCMRSGLTKNHVVEFLQVGHNIWAYGPYSEELRALGFVRVGPIAKWRNDA